MATLDEIAAGISTVLLMAPAPEPLYVDLKGHSPQEIAFLIRAVVEACKLRKAPLSHVRVCHALGSQISHAFDVEPLSQDGVTLEVADELAGRLEFFRFPTG
jgi:hypothetical protein